MCVANAEDIEDLGEIKDCIPEPEPEESECADGISDAAKTCLIPEVSVEAFGGGGGNGSGQSQFLPGPSNSVYAQLIADIDTAVAAYQAREAWAVEYFGGMIFTDAWPDVSALIEPQVIARVPFSAQNQVAILAALSGYEISPDTLQAFFLRWNTSMQAWGEGA
ncbi:MAG: hypothetical protein IPG92_18500 [Flavobacteriales bacterium]|nr:hypothetical protein [Flavobacteriales bacterium]